MDWERPERTGLPEAVFCLNKSADMIDRIILSAKSADRRLFLTRLTPLTFSQLSEKSRNHLEYHNLSATALLPGKGESDASALAGCGSVALLTGGSADLPWAWEAKRTLQFLGADGDIIADIGVAGLWRLLEQLPGLKAYDVLIVFAGLEGTLPTVLGGLVPQPIIAVPVSGGYGVSNEGTTALHSMLSSCAPGISVVNIDNGFGAACAAWRILRQLSNRRQG